MTQTADRSWPRAREGKRRAVPAWARLLTAIGWVLIAAGIIVVLYLVYSLFYTNLSTEAAQASLLEEWEAEVVPGGDPADLPRDPSVPVTPTPSPPAAAMTPEPTEQAPEATAEAPDEPVVGRRAADLGGEAVALLRFVRPGADAPPVRAEPLVVVQGVGVGDLKRGPGHYPATAKPGEDGNFAVAGHRTTYGAPFFHLDQLRTGDEIHVTDRSGDTFVYRFRKQLVVGPGDRWVIGHDPFGTGTATLTLTTCHPRFSAQQRLIVFAELVT